MKKLITVLATLLLVSGCSQKPVAPEQPTESPVAPTSYKAGAASTTSIKDNGDLSVSIDTTMVGVVLDDAGKIVYVNIDVIQGKGFFTETGTVDLDKTIVKDSKKVLKEAYNMKPASPIGKEWYEQAEALEAALVGKTIEEALALPVEDNKLTDADFATTVTMKVNSYLATLEKASKNLVEVPASAAYGFANTTSLKTKDAAADKEGSIEYSTTFALVGLSADDKVEFTLIDTAQNKALFDAAGVVNAEKSVEAPTKKEKGDAYNMKPASPIGKEWFEQIASLEAYTLGKTPTEVLALPVDDKGYPTDADVLTSVTMNVSGYLKAFGDAVANKR